MNLRHLLVIKTFLSLSQGLFGARSQTVACTLSEGSYSGRDSVIHWTVITYCSGKLYCATLTLHMALQFTQVYNTDILNRSIVQRSSDTYMYF